MGMPTVIDEAATHRDINEAPSLSVMIYLHGVPKSNEPDRTIFKNTMTLRNIHRALFVSLFLCLHTVAGDIARTSPNKDSQPIRIPCSYERRRTT